MIRLLTFCASALLNSSLSSRLPLHGCFTCVSCHCSQLLSLLFHRTSLSRVRIKIGTSFDSCGAVYSPAVFPTSSRLLAFLSTSFAIASFNTSLLRSRRSASSGVVLRHSSILARQESERTCARFQDLIPLQPGHPAVVPKVSMSVLVILSLYTKAPSTGTGGGGGNGSICVAGLPTVHLQINHSTRTPITLLMAFFVRPVLPFYPPVLSRFEYTFCRLHEALGTAVSHSQPHSELVSGIHSVQRFRG